MKNELELFRERFDDIADEIEKFAVFVRGREFQEESIQKLKSLLDEIDQLKKNAINQTNEDVANGYLCFEYMADALLQELNVYIDLKDDNPSGAWNHLIAAQMATSNAMKAHSLGDHLSFHAKKLLLLEKLLFPSMIFFSAGYVVNYSECSICGSEYGECDHIKGKPYMGKLCVRIMKDCEPTEVSVVQTPADKRCRIISFSEGEVTRNHLTYREQ